MESAKRCFCLVLGILVPFFDATEASNLKERPNGTSESTEQGIADNVEAGPWEQLQMALQKLVIHLMDGTLNQMVAEVHIQMVKA